MKALLFKSIGKVILYQSIKQLLVRSQEGYTLGKKLILTLDSLRGGLNQTMEDHCPPGLLGT